MNGTAADLGLIGEWAYDDRGSRATTPFQNDLMLGLRLTFNDAPSSELLAGLLQDGRSSSRAIQVEASRRIGTSWRISLETRAFFDLAEDDLFSSLRDDDCLRLELSYYF